MSWLLKLRRLGRSPVAAFLRVNRWLWPRVPAPLARSRGVRAYGRTLHRLVRLTATRRQYFGTFFFRNRPALALIRQLSERRPPASTLKIAFLGCSNGAELYSTLWTIRTARPDLDVVSCAVDISPEILERARAGVYSRTADPAGAQLFSRMTEAEMLAMFEPGADRDELRVKPWLREGVSWRVGDAGDPALATRLGPQHLVIANNFLCHMDAADAERCLRSIVRLAMPGGCLVVSGVDLDVRTRVALELALIPRPETLQEIHDGDPSVRNDWPWQYWGLEPFDPAHPGWPLRYAAVFQVPASHAAPGTPPTTVDGRTTDSHTRHVAVLHAMADGPRR